MGSDSDNPRDLLVASYAHGYGDEKVALLERAARLADEHNDDQLSYKIRTELIDAYTFSGYSQKMLITFAWCLGKADKDPEKYNVDELLWKYKWAISRISDFPDISREQALAAWLDMKRRFGAAGAGLRAPSLLRMTLAMDMGEPDDAREAHDDWMDADRDWLSDCNACEFDTEVQYCIFQGDNERALSTGFDILKNNMRCAEMPHRVLARMLLPMFQEGRAKEAVPLHARGYKMISKNKDFVEHIADHINFLTLTLNLPRAVKLYEKHYAWSLSPSPFEVMIYRRAGALLFSRMAKSGKDSVKLTLPKSVPYYADDLKYSPLELAKHMEAEARTLAKRFDKRNGNDYWERDLDGTLALVDKAVDVPLKAKDEGKKMKDE